MNLLFRIVSLLAAWSFLVSGTIAQNAGTVRLLVDPGHNFKFIVDKQFKLEQREVELSEGLHQFSVWAPERMVVDTPVFVVAGRSTDLVVRLPYSPEFKAYNEARSKYQTKKRWTQAAPLLVMAGGLVWTTLGYTNYSKAKKVLEDDREAYRINASPSDIRTLKDVTIPEHNKDLDQARNSLYIGTGIVAISAAATYYLMRKTAKWERPIFNDTEKVKFDGLVWMPTDRGTLFMAGLTIGLGR